jgi:NADH dehydrogenase
VLRPLVSWKKLGVDVYLNTRIEDYQDKTIRLSNGEAIKSENVIWTAGVSGLKLKGLKEEDYARANRIKVDAQCKLSGYKNIYALGDISYLETEEYPDGHPQVAQVAIQQAKLMARTFKKKKTIGFFSIKIRGPWPLLVEIWLCVICPVYALQAGLPGLCGYLCTSWPLLV